MPINIKKRNPPNESGDLLLNVKSEYGNYLRFLAADLRLGAALRFLGAAFLAGRFATFFLAAILYYFTLLSRYMSSSLARSMLVVAFAHRRTITRRV